MDSCPVCDRGDIKVQYENLVAHVMCSTCGNYSIATHASDVISYNQEYKNKRYILSGIIRERSEQDIHVKVLSTNIENILDSASIPDGPFEAIDRIILHIYRNAPTVASGVIFKLDDDYPIAYARNPGEFRFYLGKASELGYLEKLEGWRCRLNLEGWKRVDELRRKQVRSNQAFVAMWFPDEEKEVAWKAKLEAAWKEGFKKALEDTGYKNPIKINLVEHNDKICDRIIAEIKKSGLLIADFTGNRGGVYFEAGFAKGLGIPVIWTCHKEYEKKIHFDTRQYNHIFWENPQELKEKLINRIDALLPSRVRRGVMP